MSQTPRIGWIGTGVMGSAMCGRLIAAGYGVSVFNRTRDRASGLLRDGAVWRSSPAEVAANSDVIFTMLGSPADVRNVILGQRGVLLGALPGSWLIDMTTSDPLLAQEVHEAAASKEIASLDAPVSGGDTGARNGSLVIMVGGTEEAFSRALPLFMHLGKTVVHEGGPGTGQHTKIVNQIAIASSMIGVSEALLYAQCVGLDIEQVIDTIAAGAAASWLLANYAPRMVRGDFESGGTVDLFMKDLGIALAAARKMNLVLPGLALAEKLYSAVRSQGLGQHGIQALILGIAHLSGVDWARTTA
jgi:3-hydroxyisobutyrate dehydrogenase